MLGQLMKTAVLNSCRNHIVVGFSIVKEALMPCKFVRLVETCADPGVSLHRAMAWVQIPLFRVQRLVALDM